MSDNSRPNNRVLLLSEMRWGHSKFFVNSSIFFPIKILQSKFSFYCNKLGEIIQFNSGVRRTMKRGRIEQRKHQNNSNPTSKVFVDGGHPKCIINTAVSLATPPLHLKAGHGFAALQKSSTITTAIFDGKFILCYFFQNNESCFTQNLFTFCWSDKTGKQYHCIAEGGIQEPLRFCRCSSFTTKSTEEHLLYNFALAFHS